ncbi:MAG: MBL fold metallo-hydrolase [Myxococcales bacterium]|nr:MBL fold metallo-hydrolase [Myxococcales bacterium]
MDRERITRLLWLGLAMLAMATLGYGFLAIGWVASELPAGESERVRGPLGAVGVRSGGTYAWVVPSDDGVVLIDTGKDTQAPALLAEVGGRPVRAILLTHAHTDHLMGLAVFPDAPVWVTPQDASLLRGERTARGWFSSLMRSLTGDAPIPRDIHELTPDQELDIDGARFWVASAPGHTDGSVAYLWEDVLFAGDALWGGPQVTSAPEALADDRDAARASVEKLAVLDFDELADGHVGLTHGARAALFHLLEKPITPPTISMRSEPTGPHARTTKRTGRLVRAPEPDVRGEQPELLLIDGDPEPWRLSSTPVPEHDAWIGRRVVVRARPTVGAGRGKPMEVLAIEAAPGEDAAPPAPDSAAHLDAWVGRWTSVDGAVRDFRPLDPDASWGEGQLVLADGSAIPLAAPVDQVTDGRPWHGTVRVDRQGGGPLLVAVVEPVTDP